MQNTRLRPCVLTAIAVTLGCAVSGTIAQSSVTLYGTVDAGPQYQNRSTAGDSITEVHSSGTSPSIWGLKGSENPGSGLRANSNLKGHFNSDTGTLAAGPGFSSELFHRQANVGLNGDWRAITLGRQYSPALIGAIGTGVRGFREQFSSLCGWAYNQLPTPGGAMDAGISPGNDAGVFIDNALQYSNNFSPVWLGAAYSFGETAGSLRRGNGLSSDATYTDPAIVGLDYQSTAGSGTGETLNHLWSAGVATPFGAFTGHVNCIGVTNNAPIGQRVSDVRSIGVRPDYEWNPANAATLTGYYSKYESSTYNSSTKPIVLSNDYAFSKHTTLYTQPMHVNASAVGTVDPLGGLRTSVVADGTTPGTKTVLAGAGLKHSF